MKLAMLVAVGLFGCATAPRNVAPDRAPDHATPPAASKACVGDAGTSVVAADVDGDGTLDVVVVENRALAFYVRHADCLVYFARIPLPGPLAFVHVDAGDAGIRPISIETWLVHGDRRVQSYEWNGQQYVTSGTAHEVLGRRR